MGKPGKCNDPEVVLVIGEVFKKTLAKGKAVGIYCATPNDIKKYVQIGATYVAYSSDVTAMAGALKSMKKSVDELFDN